MTTGNSMMQLERGAGWTRGLNNMLRAELAHWFGTRRWWTQILIWAAIVNGLVLIVALSAPEQAGADAAMLFNVFLGMGGAIGICIIMQGSIVGEKTSGTAAWVLSKPLSRPAFIVSKFVANMAGVTVCMVLAQGLIAYLIMTLVVGITLSPLGFIAALGVHLANLLFYLTLTLMLGAIFQHPAPVIGLPMAFVFFQQFLPGLWPPLVNVIPYTLTMPLGNGAVLPTATALMTGTPVATFTPLISALVTSAVFFVVGLLAFGRQEL